MVANRRGRLLRLLVVDTSPEASDAAGTRAAVASATGAIEARYWGPREVQRRAAIWAERAGVDLRVVEFATSDPFGIGYAPGASRNAIALACCGRPYLSVDDDMGLRCGPSPDATSGSAAVTGDPTEFWFDEPPAPFGTDLIARHEAVLGRHVGAAESATAVRATWTGFAGDAATPNPMVSLGLDGPSRARLLRDRATFDKFGATRRLIRGVRRFSFGAGSIWTTGAAAYDGSPTLPPFLPVGRGEGLVFAALFRATSAGWLGYLPWIVRHDPPEDRSGSDDEARGLSFPLAALVCRLICASEGKDLAQLGAHLERFGQGGPGAVGRLVDHHRRAFLRARIRMLATVLERYGENPHWWSARALRHLRALQRELDASAIGGVTDIEHALGKRSARVLLPELLTWWGRLVAAWPRLTAPAQTS